MRLFVLTLFATVMAAAALDVQDCGKSEETATFSDVKIGFTNHDSADTSGPTFPGYVNILGGKINFSSTSHIFSNCKVTASIMHPAPLIGPLNLCSIIRNFDSNFKCEWDLCNITEKIQQENVCSQLSEPTRTFDLGSLAVKRFKLKSASSKIARHINGKEVDVKAEITCDGGEFLCLKADGVKISA